MKIHVTGLGFPEGPVWLPEGAVAFVDLRHQAVRRYDGRRMEVLATLSGSPNGMRRAPDGSLLVANNGGLAPRSLTELWRAEPEIGGRIQRLNPGGTVEDVVTELPGPPPWRPNDLAIAPTGEIVFTDSANWEVLPDETRYHGGRLCAVTGEGRVVLLAEVWGFPNGLVFVPDGSLLVAQTLRHDILRFAWRSGAGEEAPSVGAPDVWATLPTHIAPDGLAWHGEYLYVAGSVGDEVLVLDHEARLVRTIATGPGSDPTNLCIGGGRLWVTLGLPGQLVSVSLGE
ncbi:MAG: hypothetical protein A2X23_09125 [Chloroflexi bacterium GWC2_73_18]|nr:MAG: hypothetical protein A2X23_09125 [Chloroflexi bacterium GWC2_73_18]